MSCPANRTACFFRTCAFFVLAASAVPVIAEPGSLRSVTLEGVLSPSQVDAFIAQLYKGYSAPSAKYSVAVYGIHFSSTYPDGAEAPAYAQVFIPRFDGKEKTRALYVFGPGSTGLTDACRPSREHTAGIRWGLYRAHVLSHAGQGTVGAIPDYLGFGDPDRDQYYMVSEAEAAVMLDTVRAVRGLIKKESIAGIASLKPFVSGFSQGGHAAFAAADFQSAYAKDVRLYGVIGYGPSTDLVVLFRQFPQVAPMVLYTFRNLYGKQSFNPDLVLASPYAKNLDSDVIRQCVGGMQSYYPATPEKLFTAEFTSALLKNRLETAYPGIYQALKRNSPGLTRHGIPVLILQGTEDVVIHRKEQEAFVAACRSLGQKVELRILEGVRHDTRQVSFQEVQAWMNGKL